MKIVHQCGALVRVFVAVAAGALLMSAIAGPAAAQNANNNNNSNKPVLTFNGGASANGSIKVSGQGLVLAGGANPGQAPTPATTVLANLLCQTAAGPPPTYSSSMTSTAGVTLLPNGDFQINDTLSPLPPVPCALPVLLIQGAANSHWFALGILSP